MNTTIEHSSMVREDPPAYGNRNDAGEFWKKFAMALERRGVSSKARPYYAKWIQSYLKTCAGRAEGRDEDSVRHFVERVGRAEGIESWQVRQAISALRIGLAEVQNYDWAKAIDWKGLVSEIRELEKDHPTVLRDQEGEPEGGWKDAKGKWKVPAEGEQEEVQRLVRQTRNALRVADYAVRTEESYLSWIARFTRYCLRVLNGSPETLGPPAITAYLDFLALVRKVTPSTQKQAMCAIVFLFRNCLGAEDLQFDRPVLANPRKRIPVVMTRKEVRLVIAALHEPWRLVAEIMYGSGLRLMECLRLRVKDLDFGQGTITIREGKGDKERVVPLPMSLTQRLKDQLELVRQLRERDLEAGTGEVYIRASLSRKYPGAKRELAWKYLFPAAGLSRHPRGGNPMRHHLHEGSMQQVFKRAVQATGITKRSLRPTCWPAEQIFAPFRCCWVTLMSARP